MLHTNTMNLIENRHRGVADRNPQRVPAPPKGAAVALLLPTAVKACNAIQDAAVTLLTEGAVTPLPWAVARLCCRAALSDETRLLTWASVG